MNKRYLDITSHQNPKVKELIRLREKRERKQSNKFLIEGYREITRAAQGGYPIETLFFCEDLFLGTNEYQLIDEIGKKATLFRLEKSVFEKCSYRDRPDGLIAVAPIKQNSMAEFIYKIHKKRGKDPLFLVIAEAIEKPGNLGSIFRSSDAAGVHGILVCDEQVDVFNPNVVRASVGTLFAVPHLECTFGEALELLRKENIKLVAATPHAKATYTEVDLKQAIAIAMGTEQLGLSKAMMSAADIQVKIPMYGIADSLNVAAATTLMLYEAVRQRHVV